MHLIIISLLQYRMELTQSRSIDESKSTELEEESELHFETKFQRRKSYGNMLVLCQKPIPITLGPNYVCFSVTLLLFCLSSLLTIFVINSTVQSLIWRVANYVMCVSECIAYLAVGLSDPGIVFNTSELQGMPESEKKHCVKCGFMTVRQSRHCLECNVCVKGHDHHCPWTSKCIGQNNLCRFYIFLVGIPIYLIYLMGALVACAQIKIASLGENMRL